MNKINDSELVSLICQDKGAQTFELFKSDVKISLRMFKIEFCLNHKKVSKLHCIPRKIEFKVVKENI